jgi:adenylosuccinate lyase
MATDTVIGAKALSTAANDLQLTLREVDDSADAIGHLCHQMVTNQDVDEVAFARAIAALAEKMQQDIKPAMEALAELADEETTA